MSHKAAKKVRKLLNSMAQENTVGHVWNERDYTENEKKRKKQLVELKTGEQKEIEVSLGQISLKPGSGRSIYKVIKRSMAGKQQSSHVKAALAPELLPAPEPELIKSEPELIKS